MLIVYSIKILVVMNGWKRRDTGFGGYTEYKHIDTYKGY